MKKIIFFLFILGVTFASCKDKNAYTVEGSFSDSIYDGKMAYLQKMDSLEAKMPSVIDSATIVGSKFTFQGIADNGPMIGFVSVGKVDALEPQSPLGTVVLEPGSIKITFDKSDVSLAGTPTNDEFNKIHQIMGKMSTLYKEVSEAGGLQNVPLDGAGLDAATRLNNIQKELQQANFDFTKANMGNKVGEFLFVNSLNMFTKEQLIELLKLSDNTFRIRPNIKSFEEQLNKVVPNVGESVKDVQLVDRDDKPVALTQYVGKGKYVLIDFWASWCGPCIQEMPTLVSIYDKYRNKGFEIVGISVDQEKDKWLEAVQTHKMTWVQLADSDASASDIYDVTSIPHTILVDQNGTIIAKNLRGAELQNKLAEIFK